MAAIVSSKVKRASRIANYTAFNKRGFSTIKTVRNRRRPDDVLSMPGSPQKCDNSILHQAILELNKVKGTRKNKKMVKQKNKGKNSDVEKETFNVTEQSVHTLSANAAKVGQPTQGSPVKEAASNSSISSLSNCFVESGTTSNKMAGLNLEGLSREEKKRVLRASIAQLEEEEEDRELQELLAKHDKLKRKQEGYVKDDKQGKGKTPSKKRLRSPSLNTHLNMNNCIKLNSESSHKRPFNVDEFTKGKLPDISDLQNLLQFSEESEKSVRHKKPKKTRGKQMSSSSSSTSESSDSEWDSDEADEETYRPSKKKKSGSKKTSGLYARAGNTRIVTNELFAHAALEDEIGTDRELKTLSFNLFVAGELEIVLDGGISKVEKQTRLQILRSLAYKHEYLSCEEILNQYTSFV